MPPTAGIGEPMHAAIEAEAIRLLEMLFDVPAAERSAWLQKRQLSTGVAARLDDLLAAEPRLGAFLSLPAVAEPFDACDAGLPAAGERLGTWRLVRELGRGTMGVVFLAERDDGTFDQRVAIKVMRSPAWPSPGVAADAVRRFDAERRLLARLEHRNIVRILDGGSTTAGTPYLVMEFVEGCSLTEYASANGLDVAARVRLVAKVCDGVQAAHRHLIVHRDLKPQNILVDREGEPRVVDFGIARLTSNDPDRSDVTATGFAAMTPAYASPEQARHEPLGTSSDVYSLGVILYELVAGVRPYSLDGLSPAERERVITTHEPTALRHALAASKLDAGERRRRAAGIGNDLERIVARALHKDPERRYGSAEAFGEDLRRCLDGRPVLAHPDGVGYRCGRFVRRHRVGSAATVVALTAILIAAGAALWQAAAADRSAADTRRINTFLVDLLSDSNPYESGSEITLAHALDNAAAKVNEQFGDRPDLAVDIHYALGKSMLSRYRLDAAEGQLKRAIDEGTRAFGPDDEHTIRAIASLASLRKEQSRDADATALYQDALERIRRGGWSDTELESTILNDFGVFYLILGEYAKADELLQRAVASGKRSRVPISPEEQAQTLGNLAHAARGLGQLDRADALYQEAQARFEKLYPDGGPYLAVVLNNRARLARDRGKPEQALEFLQRAVAMHRHSFTGDHVMVLVPMTNLARQAADLGRVEVAAPWAEQAVAMADRMYTQTDHFYHAQALTTLAQVRLMQKRDGEANDLLLRARQSLAKLEKKNTPSEEFLERIRTRLCTAPHDPPWPACADRGRAGNGADRQPRG